MVQPCCSRTRHDVSIARHTMNYGNFHNMLRHVVTVCHKFATHFYIVCGIMLCCWITWPSWAQIDFLIACVDHFTSLLCFVTVCDHLHSMFGGVNMMFNRRMKLNMMVRHDVSDIVPYGPFLPVLHVMRVHVESTDL
jgi:hypothetical protein